MAAGAAAAEPADTIPLVVEVEQLHNPPAPGGDVYSVATAYQRWTAVAIRSRAANDTLSVYDTADKSELLARSAAGGSKIDFVASYSYSPNPVWPVVTRRSGEGQYTIEASRYGSIGNGNLFRYQTTKSDVLRVFDADLTGGTTATITVDPANKLDVSVFVMRAVGSNHQPRQFAEAEAHAGGAGVTETVEYAVPASGRYAIVVLFQKGGGAWSIGRTDT